MIDKNLRDGILAEIAKSYPFSLEDVKGFYNMTKSLDATIQACESAVGLGIDLIKILELARDGLPDPIRVPEFPGIFKGDDK